MRLAQRTDYALRVLMHLAVSPRVAPVPEIAGRYGISRDHVMKIAQELARCGWVRAERGRTGGLALVADPARLSVGAVVRHFEPDFDLVECFSTERDQCVLTPACELRGVLARALEGFLAPLDAVTLAELTAGRDQLTALLGIEPAGHPRTAQDASS